MHRTSPTTAAVVDGAVAGSIVLGNAPSAKEAAGVSGNRGWESVADRGWSQYPRDAADLVDH
jgi:hypothetical protein